MVNKSEVKILAGALVVLVAALAATFGIRKFWPLPPEPKPQAERREPKPAAPGTAEDVKPPKITAQDEELLLWLEQEVSGAEEAQPMVEEQYAFEDQPQVAAAPREAEPPEPRGPMAQRFGGWGNDPWGLNLTEEERARLQEGFAQAWQRWQDMSDEDRMAEMERMRTGWERWQNMSDEEREQAAQRIREQFEEWRRSGRVELPQISLD